MNEFIMDDNSEGQTFTVGKILAEIQAAKDAGLITDESEFVIGLDKLGKELPVLAVFVAFDTGTVFVCNDSEEELEKAGMGIPYNPKKN